MIVPTEADQLIAPADVNCSVLPRITVEELDEMMGKVTGTRVTVAVPEPPGPFAVIVTEGLDGRLDGAV